MTSLQVVKRKRAGDAHNLHIIFNRLGVIFRDDYGLAKPSNYPSLSHTSHASTRIRPDE